MQGSGIQLGGELTEAGVGIQRQAGPVQAGTGAGAEASGAGGQAQEQQGKACQGHTSALGSKGPTESGDWRLKQPGISR